MGTGMNIAYVRVSTVEQNEERQIENLKKFNIDKWYIEKKSAKNTNRPELQEMLGFVRDGDTVYIDEFSRLARNTKDLLTIVELLENKNVNLVSNREGFDIKTPVGKAMLAMTGAIAQMERDYILERQREGIAVAKRNNVYKGRKPVERKEFGRYYKLYKSREINKVQFAKIMEVSRPTLDRMIERYEAKIKETIDNI